MKKIYIVGVVWLSAVYSHTVLALGDVKVDGFMSFAVTRDFNDKNTTYYNGVATKKITLDSLGNRFGLQFAAQVDSNTDIAAQIIARGGQPNYNVTTDFAYINYKPDPSWKILIGKYKISQFLVSDYALVGYAYPWVRPPQDVYSTNPLFALSGINVFYKKPMGDSNFLAQAFYGNGTHQTFVPARTLDYFGNPDVLKFKGQLVPFSTTGTQGFNIGVSSNIYTLRIGYFSTRVNADVTLLPATPTSPAAKLKFDDVWGSFGGLGFTMDLNNYVTYLEFVSRDTAPEMKSAFPDQYAGYVTFGHRSGKYLPYLTYSKIQPGKDKSTLDLGGGQSVSLALEEQSVALGLRYELSNASAIKFEVMQVVPEKSAHGGNHGLFNDPVDEGWVVTSTYDVIF